MSRRDRRTFLRQFIGGATATATVPHFFLNPSGRFGPAPDALPLVDRDQQVDEAYWEAVVGQFSLRPGLVMMNAANLCPAPYSVSQAVVRYTDSVNADASFQNRGKFAQLHARALEALAKYVGAHGTRTIRPITCPGM